MKRNLTIYSMLPFVFSASNINAEVGTSMDQLDDIKEGGHFKPGTSFQSPRSRPTVAPSLGLGCWAESSYDTITSIAR